jgi:excisionase family DNA binding protein
MLQAAGRRLIERHDVERLLSAAEVAEVLGVPVGTLYQWRHRGTGPKGLRVGRHLRYRISDVEAHLTRLATDKECARRAC